MSELPYFPFYMGDYLADTGSLDTTEHGAYLLIMIEYYKRRQGPSADPKKLAKITKMSPKRWQKISDTILEFFEIREGRLWQKRAEREIKNMLQTHEILSENGRKGAQKRWGKKDSPAIAPPVAPPSEGQWQSDSDSESLKPKTPLPQQAGESENEEEKPIPKNSRVHGTNPRALGTNPRAISGKERADAERLAAIEEKIDREIYDAWAEANACTREESLEAIAAIKQTLRRQQEDEVVI